MKKWLIDQFKDGIIWAHDIESANEMVTKYIKSIGGDELMAEDILMIITESDRSLNEWDGNEIIKLVDDYIDR